RRQELSAPALGPFRVPHIPLARSRGHPSVPTEAPERKTNIREQTEKLLLQSYAPACVAINKQVEILYVHGRTGKYLEIPAGEPNLNIIRAAREGLKMEVANAIRKVISLRKPARYEGLEVRTNGGFETVTMNAQLADGPEGASNVI